MNGLIYKDLKGALNAMKPIYILLSIAFYVFIIVRGGANSEIITSFSASWLVGMLSFLIVYGDEKSKWNKFEMILPLSKEKIVGSKYLLQLSVVPLSVLFTFLICTLSSILFVPVNHFVYTALLTLSFMIPLISGSVMFPLSIKLGTKVTRIVLMFFIYPILKLATAFQDGTFSPEIIQQNQHYLILGILLSVALYGLSYFISVKLYKRKL
ncbi:MAG TPA: ABC-2 transporter permease [Thermotogota bacterium]|nr:ABC-2 transporter permease [Thermotogota bacterium]